MWFYLCFVICEYVVGVCEFEWCYGVCVECEW